MALAAGDTFAVGDYTYRVLWNDNNLVNVKATDKTKTLYRDVPESVEHQGVTYYVYSLTGCFQNCRNLVKSPAFPKNKLYYESMFSGCSSLIEAPDLSDLHPGSTGSVRLRLLEMFEDCSSLTRPPSMPIMESPGGVNLDSMFQRCTSLVKGPDLSIYDSGFNVSLGFTFDGCESLQEATLPKRMNDDVRYPLSNNNLACTFRECASLVHPPELPMDAFGSMSECFEDCTSLAEAPAIPNGITSMIQAFNRCQSLRHAPSIPSGVTELKLCFGGCTSLVSAPSTPPTVTDMSSCFYNCSSLKTPPDMSNTTIVEAEGEDWDGMKQCFRGCTSLETPPVIPDGVADMSYVFQGCRSLKSAPAIPSTVTTMENCFYGCSSLETPPDMSGATGVTNMDCTFFNCHSLKSAPTLPASVADVDKCFYGCSSLTGTVLAKCTPTEREGVFDGTREPIFIVLDGAADETTWRAVANLYENVYFFADANSKPALSFVAKRVAADQDTAEDTGGTWVYVTATATAYKDRLPEGYGNSIASLSMRANGQAESVTWQVVSTEEVDFKMTRVYRGWFEATTAKQALAMTVTDEYAATSPTITAVLPSTAMLLDFLAGSRGTGLALGKRATRDGFDCALPACFGDDVTIENEGIDRDAEPNATAQLGEAVIFTDKDGERIGVVRVDRDSGGIMRMKMGAFTENSNGIEVNNWFTCGIDRTGKRYYGMDKGVMLDALGLGGTSKVATVSDVIAPASGITVTAANFAQWGKVAQLVIDYSCDQAITVPAHGNITNVTVGTLVSGKRPVYFKAAHSNGDGAGQQWYGITAAGVITLRAMEGTGAQRTVAAGTTLSISAVYLLP